ncbi:MAG: hypothetical protein ACYC3F_16180 [Gemmatimonadaceae bacterium]
MLRTPDAPGADADFADIMRRLGATTPATACPDRELPQLTRERFRDLLDRGVLREGAPRTFYLYERAVTPSVVTPPARTSTARAVVLRVLFWLVVILVPVLLIQRGQE